MAARKTEYAPFDIASHLDSDEMIAGYLTAAAEDENPDVLLLASGAQPRMSTARAILRALNVRLTIKATPPRLAKAHRKTRPPKSSATAAEETARKAPAKKAALKKPAPRRQGLRRKSSARNASEKTRMTRL